jgi:hypothetical protein
MHMLQRPDSLIPVPIKVQQLQRRLLMEEHRSVFGRMWNWVDAYLLITHGAGSERYLFLRQALMARRALVILDGIDEGGRARREIERHVTEVLAPQGHVMLVTSRPAGFNWSIFERGFHAMVLRQLSDHQQRQVIEQRIGDRTLLDQPRISSTPPRCSARVQAGRAWMRSTNARSFGRSPATRERPASTAKERATGAWARRMT